jgi:hypothetical protein
MADDRVRRPLLLRAVMEILRDTGKRLPPSQVYEALRQRVDLSPFELSLDDSGLPRYERAVGFTTMGASTAGWITKGRGWEITEVSIQVSAPIAV